MAHSFFDCMIVVGGNGKSCRVSDLYTKKDPFIRRPQSFHDLSMQEKEASKNEINNPNKREAEL